jgi:phosphatidate cytidylyltransferase
MLVTRILTALVLLALLAAAALTSKVLLLGALAFLLAACLYEWLLLTPTTPRMAMVGALVGGIFAWLIGIQQTDELPRWVIILWLLSLVLWSFIVLVLLRVQQGIALPFEAPGLQMLAWSLCFSAWLALAYLLQNGIVWVISVLAIVWVADIAAYAFGRLFGRAKLADRLSPGKTWAGVWGALATVLVLSYALCFFAPALPLWSTQLLRHNPFLGGFILVCLVVLSIAGDLFESAVKRRAGVKDSGRLLPGHGGAWDRLDACLPALPLAALVQIALQLGMSHV